MEAIRKIVDAERLVQIIDLPDSMKNRRVELIILPFVENDTDKTGVSMKGFLKTYANSVLYY